MRFKITQFKFSVNEQQNLGKLLPGKHKLQGRNIRGIDYTRYIIRVDAAGHFFYIKNILKNKKIKILGF